MIVGITGTLGAGKGTVVRFLQSRHSFAHFSVRDYLLRIIAERGLPPNRDSMVEVANELRREHSPSYLVEQLCREAQSIPGCRNFVIESIRTPGEVEALRKLAPSSFHLLAVDADPHVRYGRILQRSSETDGVTLDEFLDNERREMHSDDPTKQNLGRCIELADTRLRNDGTEEELWGQVERALQSMGIDRGS